MPQPEVALLALADARGEGGALVLVGVELVDEVLVEDARLGLGLELGLGLGLGVALG